MLLPGHEATGKILATSGLWLHNSMHMRPASGQRLCSAKPMTIWLHHIICLKQLGAFGSGQQNAIYKAQYGRSTHCIPSMQQAQGMCMFSKTLLLWHCSCMR